jgi:tubulin---tyrosine ligase
MTTTTTTSTTNLRLHRTLRFEVIGTEDEKQDAIVVSKKPIQERFQRPPSDKNLSIFLDINELYTRQVISNALRMRVPQATIIYGPGEGDDEIPLPPNCDFQWSEYERIDWSAVLAGKHGASSYCVRKGLSRKAQLAHFTRLHVCKNPDSLLKDAIPKTVILDTWPVWEDESTAGAGGLDDILVGAPSRANGINRRKLLDKCLQEAKLVMSEAEHRYEKDLTTDPKANAPVWILKPSTVNKGAGIEIVHLYEQLVDICWNESEIREWVLQRYIDPPLLLGKRKFHIRAYVLAVSALRVYFFRDCLALCCGRRYRRFDTSNKFAHLTNTAFQDLDPDFVEDDCVRLWDDADAAQILVQDGTCHSLNDAKEKVNEVVNQMERITGELFRAYKNEFGVFAPIEGCFEHYGFDFMVGRDWRVSLLEVNPGPDFKQTGSRLSRVIETLMCDTIDAALLDDNNPNVGRLALVYDTKMRGQAGISMKLT